METIEVEGIIGFLEIGGFGFISYYWKKFNKNKQETIDKNKQEIIDKNNEIQDLKNKIQLLELKLELRAGN